MKALACYKVLYEDQDIKVNPDRSLSFSSAELKLSLYDLNAVEEAVKIAESTSGTAVALTIGDLKVENSKLKKAILSRGLNELFIVKDLAFADLDAHQTAVVLAAAAKKIGFDLIICGEGSADNYSKQVGIQLGEILGLPVINFVSKVTPQGDKILVERTLENMVELLEIPLPAVINITSDINVTRLPSMKDILAAGKKPVTEWTVADIGITDPAITVDVVTILAPKQSDRKQIIIDGDDKVAVFFEKIRNEVK